jgi:hypothetical protein
MNMKRTLAAGVALLLLNIAPPLLADDVQIADVSEGRITMIGRLGRPVGTVVTMEGQLIADPKNANGHITTAIRVTRVDGKELPKAQTVGIEFRPSQGMPPLHANQLVKLYGYEGAAFIGTPDAAREDMGGDASPFDWKLSSLFHVIKIL